MVEKRKFIGGVDFEDLRSQRVQLYDTFQIALTTKRSNEEMVIAGNYLYGLESSILGANIDIRFNEIARKPINIVLGRGVRIPFYRLYLTHAAQVGQTITLAIGTESESFEILDTGKAIEITGGVRIGGASGTPAAAQVAVNNTATLIKAANSNRRAILVQNLDAANALFIGYANTVTTGNAGHRLAPYEAVELNAESTIYGIRAAGTGNAAYLEENNA